jgi:LPS-assembly protein
MTLVFKNRTLIVCALLAVGGLLVGSSAGGATPLQVDKAAPVSFQAKQLTHDDEHQTVTAIGDVEFEQGGKILRADKVVYHLDTDTAQAMGNVSILDADGSVHFAASAELSQNLKDGYVQGLLSLLADGSRFTAAAAKREDGTKMTMTDVTYTPCKVCEADPHPIWQIKADKVTHNEQTKEIKYKNARFELFGIPLVWTPIFSHADPSVKRKSGLLRPRYGWSNNIGTFVEGGYYYSIAPDKDATVLLRPTTREGILVQGEWRQRFENGQLKFDGSFAKSDRKEEDGRVEKNKLRGDISAAGLFDLNKEWRAGFDIKRASDKGYLRLYNLDTSNVLENEVYAERFSGRDYSRIAAVNVQDLRLGTRPNQPEVVPLAEHHMMGEPQSLLGGRWTADVSVLDLQRPGPGQDMQRLTARTGWERRAISDATGLSTIYSAQFEGDSYAVQHNFANANGNTDATRGKAFVSVTDSYPLVKRLKKSQVVVEPVVAASFTSQVTNNPQDIPNEDSLDVQIDANSLFAENRFPGTDRQEDGTRLVYGVKSGLYEDDGRYGKVFVGQSYRFDDNNGLFPSGSGLEARRSDIVGQISTGVGRRFNADYRVQLDHQTLAVHRHEVQASGGSEVLRLNTRFIYLDAIAGTGFIVPREQMQVGGEYKFRKDWSVTSGALADFGDEPGVRKASLALNYADECFSFSVQGLRNLINEASGESGTTVMLRVGLKNIGEFASPEITLKPLPPPPQ